MMAKHERIKHIMVLILIAIAAISVNYVWQHLGFNSFEECCNYTVGNYEMNFVLDGRDSKFVSFNLGNSAGISIFIKKNNKWYKGDFQRGDEIIYNKNNIICSLYRVKESNDQYIRIVSTVPDLQDDISTVSDNMHSKFFEISYSSSQRRYFYAYLPDQMAGYELYIDAIPISGLELGLIQ